MNSSWADFLVSQGGVARDDASGVTIHDFGDATRELRSARDGSIVAPASHLGTLGIGGADAGGFLHGQLSSDVNALAPWQAQASAYCSAKGRALANFLLWREPERYCALLSRDLAAAIRKRMVMFVLRSKVSVEDVSEQCVLLGVAGPAAAGALSRALGGAPGVPMSAVQTGPGIVINLGEDRYFAVLRPEAAEAAWTSLAAALTPVGVEAWRWLDIRSGIPWLGTATQDQFVPQMANLELIGAVNFHKGCYPGQEIVARTQYLGKLKRRLFRCHVDAGAPPEPGASLYSASLGAQTCGTVINAARAPDGGCDLLAVIQVEAAQVDAVSPLRLGAPDGPVLHILDLPYRVPLAA